MGHQKEQVGQGEAGPTHEGETLLAALADAGRDLRPDLERQLRETLAPLSRQVRAELVAVIDDTFEVASDVEAARRQAHRLLRNAKALEAAKAVWPAYPSPPPTQTPAPAAGRVEPVAPWLAHIARHCELVADDRRYLLHHLAARSDAEAMRLAHRYVEEWAAGAAAEPQPHRQANAGRRAANAMLRGATP
ncbi:hypothetical protein RAN53_00565 [Halomonas sp. SSL-5]|uniref:hypothetical protein n=1 Tax=Halomonas sp. SSL-5 TaxID=3065855 RepID=UPI0027389271|nr:hypothetical protein [Halomonas sp. SSL-5]MDY7114827.1 hypothetical protein [Halomonas sp. SSL-5]